MTLFVGGVHAVGKTYTLKPVCERLGVRHATASQLIRDQRGLANWTISRQVEDIDDNQRALIAAVRRIEKSGDQFILDGHFVLRREVNVHEMVGVDTFAQLHVRGVILLEAPSQTIFQRLQRRGDMTWKIDEIQKLVQMESEHAQSVCQQLDIPLVRLHQPSESEIRGAIERLAEDYL